MMQPPRPGAPKRVRAQEEIPQLMADHLKVLQSHCRHFDEGEDFYAAEIAVNLRTLLWHNPQRDSHSLLNQAGLDILEFFDTAKTLAEGNPYIGTYPAGGLIYETLIQESDQVVKRWNAHFAVFFGREVFRSSFDRWWSAALIDDEKGNSISRQQMVKSIADQDRGAHVSTKIDHVYYELSRGPGFTGHTMVIQGDAVNIADEDIDPARITHVNPDGAGLRVVRALVRQIAHEVLMTLHPQVDQYVAALPPMAEGINPISFFQGMFPEPIGQF